EDETDTSFNTSTDKNTDGYISDESEVKSQIESDSIFDDQETTNELNSIFNDQEITNKSDSIFKDQKATPLMNLILWDMKESEVIFTLYESFILPNKEQ
ncbi:35884_t:CDS:2, partial [Racocetra persica]